MKKYVSNILVLVLIGVQAFGQKSKHSDQHSAIKKTIFDFLTWYSINQDQLMDGKIVVGFQDDTLTVNDRVKIDMAAVDVYLDKLKASKLVSKTFTGILRETYRSVADSLIKHPLIDYAGPIPGLESDLILGFEGNEIFARFAKGEIKHTYIIGNKALVEFLIIGDINLVFTLSRYKAVWLIDGIESIPID